MKLNKQTVGASASFAQMVAGLSHHLNNPLAAILGYSELLLRRDLDSSAKAMLELIHQQAERCKHTLQSLSDMTRRPAQGFCAVDLRVLVQECVAVRTGELEAHQIHVELDLPAAVPVSRADPFALQQVFFHLMDNAVQALDGQREKEISIKGFNANGWAVVQIRDSGCGINAEVLPRIFEPFYTTKSQEENPGLGLTICLAIMQEHDGRIEVDSSNEQGARVSLFLPDNLKPAATTTDVSKVLDGKRILVAEDEPALAQLLKTLLVPLKAHAVHVEDGLGALTSAQQNQWDLIISDIQMPGMTGLELYQRLAADDPKLANRMILITGSSRTQSENLGEFNPQFLYKPFSRSELIDAITRILTQHPREEHSG